MQQPIIVLIFSDKPFFANFFNAYVAENLASIGSLWEFWRAQNVNLVNLKIQKKSY